LQAGPRELIGVLEVRADGGCRAVFAERTEVDGRCHILLAREAWGYKDALDTRWYSLVLDPEHRAYTVRTGSCGDPLTRDDVPRIARALEELDLVSEHTMIHVNDGPAVFPARLARA
ncbi:MAG TPA: hypothetical protein VFX98_16370, partial [Longimicrobiaceae bacterium]|nr:hypothetical protein [Longimicrobiaceae bacterium]